MTAVMDAIQQPLKAPPLLRVARPEPAFPRRMSEAEFEAWCHEDIAAEYVDGEVIVHSPVRKQHTVLAIFFATAMKLVAEQGETGEVFGPEFQVRLRPGLRRIPDVMFVAQKRAEIVRETYVEGAPDLVVEIVSPDSVERDWRKKHLEYQEAGVSEYWIVDPAYQLVRAYALDDEGRYAAIAEDEGWLRSQALPGLALCPEWLWQERLPTTLALAQELGLLAAPQAEQA